MAGFDDRRTRATASAARPGQPVGLLLLTLFLLTAPTVQAADDWAVILDGHSLGGRAESSSTHEMQDQKSLWETLVSYEKRPPRRAAGRRTPSRDDSSWRGADGMLTPRHSLHGIVREASRRFDIPVAVLHGLIQVESGWNPRAKAATSSAKGLMQTIDDTFALARSSLAGEGLSLPDDPYDPYASVMAGSWYLSRMYDQARADHGFPGRRDDLRSWHWPLQYYHAGPQHGRLWQAVVSIPTGSRQVTVNKAVYARKVLAWAARSERS